MAKCVSSHNFVVIPVECQQQALCASVVRNTSTFEPVGTIATKAVGGMCHPARAVARLTRALEAGQAVRDLLVPFLRRLGALQLCLSAIGSDREDVGPTPDSIKDARDAVAQLVGATSTDPFCVPISFSAWARFSGDPDTDVVSWLTEGAPAGILDHPL